MGINNNSTAIENKKKDINYGGYLKVIQNRISKYIY